MRRIPLPHLARSRTSFARTAGLGLGLLLGLAASGWAGTSSSPTLDPHEPRLVEVALGDSLDVADLVRAGLDVIEYKGGTAQVLEWPADAERLARLGARWTVLDPHPSRAVAERSLRDGAARARAGSAVAAGGGTLPPFGAGSMGGYWTLAEVKMKLDALVASDTRDLVADAIDTIGTSVEGRPIWGLRVGTPATGPDPRPVVFMNALTHAREPMGMQALLYFVDDLLARHGVDPFATYLLEQRVLYVVPVVNPDGYAWNEVVYPNGGGMWRKNTRDNDQNGRFNADSDGVDLNRNFGFKWGHDETGSSSTRSSQTFRGAGAFSEPETRAQRDAVVALRPRSGLSFHSYGDLLLYPWGWTDEPSDDEQRFREWSDELTRDNAYLSGASTAILYPVNGEFNDWCYGDTTAKPRAFTWTPEIGRYRMPAAQSFWPPAADIVPLAAECLRTCYVTAAIAGPWIQEDGVELPGFPLVAGGVADVRVRARNLGLAAAPAGLAGRIVALDPGVRPVLATVDYPPIASLASESPIGDAPFRVAVDDTVTPGRRVRFQIAFTAPDGFFSCDTIALPVGIPTLRFADGASAGMGLWSNGSWGIVSGDAAHPSRYFSDSPAGLYPLFDNDPLTLGAPLDLSAGVHAYAWFEASWQIEPDWDALFIEASAEGVAWTPVPATGARPGSGVGAQPLGAPLYSGSRHLWKTELADLSAFAGPGRTAVRLRFRMAADDGTQYDGFSMDSLRIAVYDPAAQPMPVAVEPGVAAGALSLAAPVPNPARGAVRLAYGLPQEGETRLEVLDLAGRRVRLLAQGMAAAGRYAFGWDGRGENGRPAPAGVYFVRLWHRGESRTRRLVALD